MVQLRKLYAIFKFQSDRLLGNNTRRSYLRFDLSGISGTVLQADLQLYLRVYRNNTTHRLHAVGDDTWEESSLTFDNAPAQGDILDSWNPNGVNYYWPSATSQVQTEVDGDGAISFGLSVTSDRQNEYSSSENGTVAHRPKLIIAYQEFTEPVVSVAATGTGLEVDGTPLQFTVTRDQFLSQSFTLNFTMSGTAGDADYSVAGADSYSAGTGTIAFGANQTQAVITVTPLNDGLEEGTENVIFTLTSGSGYGVIEPTSAQGDLIDAQTNTAPQVQLDLPTAAEVAIPSGVGISLQTTATDDGLPANPGALSFQWSDVGATGNVTFTNPTNEDTGATFAVTGTYTLQLEVSDGTLSAQTQVEVTVTDGGGGGGLPPEQQVMWLKLDESTGTTSADSSGSGNNASVTGNPSWQPTGGQRDGALQFSGSDYLVVNDDDSLDGTDQLSVVMWVNPSASNNDARGLVSKRVSSSSQEAWSVFLFNSNQVVVDINGQRDTFNNITVPADTWTHLAVVFDRSVPDTNDRLRVYKNGVLAGNAFVSGSGIINSSANLVIGALNEGYNPRFAGRLDDIGLYKGRALTATEINDI